MNTQAKHHMVLTSICKKLNLEYENHSRPLLENLPCSWRNPKNAQNLNLRLEGDERNAS